VLSLLFLLLFVSCGTNTPGRKVTVSTLQGLDYLVLEGEQLETSSSSIKGTGKILFKAARPDEDSRFLFDFALEDSGSFKLVSNTNNSMTTGPSLLFQRAGEKLSVFLRIGPEDYDISADFTDINASQSLSWIGEIHAHGHVILLVNGNRYEYAFNAKPTDRLWGLELKSATVTKLAAKKAEEGE
jgi:hypothetical protein